MERSKNVQTKVQHRTERKWCNQQCIPTARYLYTTSLTARNPRLAWWSRLEGARWHIGVPRCCCFRFGLRSKPGSDPLKPKWPTVPIRAPMDHHQLHNLIIVNGAWTLYTGIHTLLGILNINVQQLPVTNQNRNEPNNKSSKHLIATICKITQYILYLQPFQKFNSNIKVKQSLQMQVLWHDMKGYGGRLFLKPQAVLMCPLHEDSITYNREIIHISLAKTNETGVKLSSKHIEAIGQSVLLLHIWYPFLVVRCLWEHIPKTKQR